MPNDTKYIVNGAQLTDIGAAIRSKLGEQDTYTVDEMPEKISEISAVSGNIEITENGENINVAPYATATVNVSGGGGDLPVGKCAVTIVNSAESTMNIDFSDSGTPINLIDGYIAHDNYLAVSNTYFEVEEAPVIAPGESLTLDLYYGHLTGNEGTGVYFNEQRGYAFTTSNVNNMEYSTESEYYVVTNSDNDSSITLTVFHGHVQ